MGMVHSELCSENLVEDLGKFLVSSHTVSMSTLTVSL